MAGAGPAPRCLPTQPWPLAGCLPRCGGMASGPPHGPGCRLGAQRPPGGGRGWRLHQPRELTAAASADALGAADLPPEDFGAAYEPPVEVFPRWRERNPYRRLGVSRDASFEEVQDARNYLYETYRAHERSRESIELAYDSILQQKMKVRHKYGFKPPKTGRKGDLDGDRSPRSLLGHIKESLEPSVPGTTLVNEGSIYLGLGLWAAWQSAAADPSLPIGAALCYAVWRLFEKRKARNPDGPYWGNSPIWGALGTTLLALFAGFLASVALSTVPLPPKLRGEAVACFLLAVMMGAAAIFLR